MPVLTEAFITPKARWARERLGISRSQLATTLRANQKKIGAWERGDTCPAFGKAQELAKTLRIAFGSISLTTLTRAIPDLRTTVEGHPAKLSADFLDLLSDVLDFGLRSIAKTTVEKRVRPVGMTPVGQAKTEDSSRCR